MILTHSRNQEHKHDMRLVVAFIIYKKKEKKEFLCVWEGVGGKWLLFKFGYCCSCRIEKIITPAARLVTTS